MPAFVRKLPTMSEVRNSPFTTNHDDTNSLTQSYSFLKCFHSFHNWSWLHQVVTSCYHGSKISGYQKTVVLFLPSFNNKNGCLRQKKRLLRSRNLAAMVTSRHILGGANHISFLSGIAAKKTPLSSRHLELVPCYSSVIFLASLRHKS